MIDRDHVIDQDRGVGRNVAKGLAFQVRKHVVIDRDHGEDRNSDGKLYKIRIDVVVIDRDHGEDRNRWTERRRFSTAHTS